MSAYRHAHERIPRTPRAPTPLARELIFAYQGSKKTQRLLGFILLGAGLLIAPLIGWATLGDGSLDPGDPDALQFGGMALMGGVVLLVTTTRTNRREVRAFRHGLPAQGRIIRRDFDMATSINGKHPFEVVWEFDANGVSHHGRLSHVDRELVERALPGSEVTVLYDPADPSANTAWID